MSIFRKILGLQSKSAMIARERLQIVVSHQHTDGGEADFLPQLRKELLLVICKYVKVDPDQVNVQLQSSDNCSVLKLNVTVPAARGAIHQEDLKVF